MNTMITVARRLSIPTVLAGLSKIGPVVGLAVALAVQTPASAVDMTGMTLKADGISVRNDYRSTNKDFTYPLEVYFGNKGNRFVKVKFTKSDRRVLIPAGEDRGSRRSPDGNFISILKLEQTATSLRVHIDSRGGDGYASETWIYNIALGNGSCTLQTFQYIPDPGQQLTRSQSKEGACTVTSGPPPGLADD